MSEREPWEIDVVQALERRIVASGARPDFLDVVERAHALAPEVVTAEALELADALAVEEAEVEAAERGPVHEEALVDAWLHDVRAAVERKVDERRERELPALPGRSVRRGAWWIAGAALAAAALLVLGVGAVRLIVRPAVPAEQALHMGEGDGVYETAETVGPRSTERATQPLVPERATQPSAAPTPAEPTPAEPTLAEPTPTEPAAASKPRAGATASRGDRFKALAEEAQAHWRAGRRAQAERLFAKIVAEAGRDRAAELAYADLFTLASQAGDAATQRRLWKDYLRRFPRGRFADDARAGLCRGAAADARAACWQAYLDDLPRGSFRGEAQAALERGAP